VRVLGIDCIIILLTKVMIIVIGQLGFERQATKGAEAFKLIIGESFDQNKSGVITNSAISKARCTLDHLILMVSGSYRVMTKQE
jgi:hypothetical protein